MAMWPLLEVAKGDPVQGGLSFKVAIAAQRKSDPITNHKILNISTASVQYRHQITEIGCSTHSSTV
jgi:hypothetical protein